MKNTMKIKTISIALALLLAFTSVMPALSAFADGGIIEIYEMQICYEDGTPVPDKDENGDDYVQSIMESEKLQLTYGLIGCNIPDGGYVKWYSETPTLVDVDDNGLVTAYDSSKGAVIQLWIDNEVKTIPLIGGIMGSMLESAFFNDTIDVDSMDTDQILNIVDTLFGSNSSYGSYTTAITSSLREYLKKLNCTVHAELCDGTDKVLADDTIKILVVKSDKWYANFLPNGTHITNKDSIDTTVAVGSTVQLEALTTPKRLKYGVTYSVQSTSIFNQGSNIAEVDENGLVTFKSKGTVTIVASPRSEDVTKGARELMKKAASLIASGDINADQLADILINTFGVNMNKTVLVALINGAVRISQYADENAETTDAIASAAATIADYALKNAYNDKITFTVIDPQPLEDFSITGPDSVQEGATIQMEITDISPSTGDISDITWTSSDPSVASIDENTGIVTGRDAGKATGSKTCTITATSAARGVSRSTTITVKGKSGNYITDATINGPSDASVGESINYTCSIYPERNSDSGYLTIYWGMVTGTDSETGEPVYTWADESSDVSDGIGTISNDGTYTAVKGGLCTIALKAVTGYSIAGGFYEMSNVTKTLDVQNDVPVSRITLSAENAGYAGTLTTTETVIKGETYKFSTVKLNAITAYYGRGATVTATIEPAAATNTDIKWFVSNDADFYTENEKNNSIQVRARASVQNATTTLVWCETADGRHKSEVMVLSVTRNNVTDNKIDGGDIEVEVDKDVEATHTLTFDGAITANYNANHEATWYSSDESIFTVATLDDRSGNAVITGVDVGTATVYCTSADGAITDSRTVTVYPNKDYLSRVVELCDETVILKTAENKKLYSTYMSKLDKAYYVLYSVPMAAQSTCDTTADNLLRAFVNLGGYVGVGSIRILDRNGAEMETRYATVNVGTLSNYKNASYTFGYEVLPENSMYSRVTWTSDNDKVKVDAHGKCTPTDNNPCSAKITCTIRDYLGKETSDYAYITFAKTPATGVTLNKSAIESGEIGNSEKLTATVQPNSVTNNATVDDVTWSTSDENVATVDSDGTVHFINGGDCIITVRTVDGGYTAQCSVHVVTNFGNLSALITAYESLNLVAEEYYPDTYNAFTSKLADAKLMVEERTASQDEVDAMCVELENAYNSLKKYVYLDKIEIYLDGDAASEYYQYDLGALSSYSNAKLNLNVRLYPNNASYESVVWESSTSFIKVTSDGVCSPSENKSGYGKVTCTVTDHFGNAHSDAVWVSFAKTPVTGVTLNESIITGEPGTTAQLTATIKPEGVWGIGKADIQDVSWSSSDEDVATVDENGLVTFVSAGAADITATSYDGGHSATCIATTLGDRTALASALSECEGIDYTDYDYEYGNAFKEALEAAESAMTDESLNQDEIDTATSNLLEAKTVLAEHPFIKIDSINLDWVASDLTSQKKSGTVGDNDSIQVIASEVARISTNAKVKVTPSVTPDTAMYQSISWETVKSNNMTVNAANDGTVTVNPTRVISSAGNAFAELRIIYTDGYGRQTTRDICVLIGDAYVTGISIDTPDYAAKGTDEPVQLQYTLTSSNGNVDSLDNKDIYWSSSDENVATVDENGVVTPVDEGTTVITARTADGGYTDSITVTITADYDVLANAIVEYDALIAGSRGKFIYTESSLDALEAAIDEARPIAEERTARQPVVNEKLAAILEAHANLERYVPAEGLTLGVNDDESVAEVINEGYIRYTGTSLNGKSFKLKVNTIPASSRYEQIAFSSDNSAVTVSADGTVKSNNSTSKVARITCTITNYDDTSYSYDAYVSFVRYGVTGISFNAEDMYYGYNGETATLSPVITYTSSTNTSSYYVKTCNYVSSDESIATVNNNGVVTFVSYGKATITATTLDGGYTASVDVYTTNDTRVLRSTLDTARALTYTDYAPEYGNAFRDKYETALAVYADPTASQELIDSSESELSAAMAALSGHPFIAPDAKIIANGKTLENNAVVETDENAKVTVTPSFADGAMLKSYTFNASNLTDATAVKNSDGSITLTRTATSGTATLTLTTMDDYDRTETLQIDIKLVEQLVPCTDITLLANGEEVGNSYTYSCGGSYSNIDLTIGCVAIPANANMIESVSYSSSSSYVKIDSETGKVTVSGLLLLYSSYKADITCTVMNSDSTVVKKTVSITVRKN